MADSELTMKLLKERCLECSICAMFFNSSLTVSIKALFLSEILSVMLIGEFFMLFFALVISCMPLRKRFSNRVYPIYPLSAQSFLFMFFRNFSRFNGSRSSTFPGVNIKLRISPLSLIIKCSLNPKNQPIEHFPRSASPLKGLLSEYTDSNIHATEWNPQNWFRYRFLTEPLWWK